jgi:hypothetical protein
MKVVAIAHRKEGASPDQFAPLLQPEADHALRLLRDEVVREIYSRTDGKGAVLVLECDDEAHARRILAELPLAKAGLLTVEVYGTKPYRGIVQHAK